jgi:hypothetical protein
MYGDASGLKEFDINKVDEELIYYHYLEIVPEVNKSFFSPFVEENNPSFRFVVFNGKLRYKCFSTGKAGTAVGLVMELFQLKYADAVDKIKRDIGFNSEDGIKHDKKFIKSIKLNKVEKTPSKIEVLTQEMKLEDLIYWGQYGIESSDLEHYDIKSCKQVWIDDRMWHQYRKNDPCYRYRLGDRYKIYRPLAFRDKKWRTNATQKHVQGFKYLKDRGDLLVITKSYKDVIVLRKHAGIESVAFSSESALIPEEAIEYFKERFDRIVLLYDNDETGIVKAESESERLNIPYKYITNVEAGTKDVSDLFKNYGKEKLISFTNSLKSIK